MEVNIMRSFWSKILALFFSGLLVFALLGCEPEGEEMPGEDPAQQEDPMGDDQQDF